MGFKVKTAKEAIETKDREMESEITTLAKGRNIKFEQKDGTVTVTISKEEAVKVAEEMEKKVIPKMRPEIKEIFSRMDATERATAWINAKVLTYVSTPVFQQMKKEAGGDIKPALLMMEAYVNQNTSLKKAGERLKDEFAGPSYLENLQRVVPVWGSYLYAKDTINMWKSDASWHIDMLATAMMGLAVLCDAVMLAETGRRILTNPKVKELRKALGKTREWFKVNPEKELKVGEDMIGDRKAKVIKITPTTAGEQERLKALREIMSGPDRKLTGYSTKLEDGTEYIDLEVKKNKLYGKKVDHKVAETLDAAKKRIEGAKYELDLLAKTEIEIESKTDLRDLFFALRKAETEDARMTFKTQKRDVNRSRSQVAGELEQIKTDAMRTYKMSGEEAEAMAKSDEGRTLAAARVLRREGHVSKEYVDAAQNVFDEVAAKNKIEGGLAEDEITRKVVDRDAAGVKGLQQGATLFYRYGDVSDSTKIDAALRLAGIKEAMPKWNIKKIMGLREVGAVPLEVIDVIQGQPKAKMGKEARKDAAWSEIDAMAWEKLRELAGMNVKQLDDLKQEKSATKVVSRLNETSFKGVIGILLENNNSDEAIVAKLKTLSLITAFPEVSIGPLREGQAPDMDKVLNAVKALLGKSVDEQTANKIANMLVQTTPQAKSTAAAIDYGELHNKLLNGIKKRISIESLDPTLVQYREYQKATSQEDKLKRLVSMVQNSNLKKEDKDAILKGIPPELLAVAGNKPQEKGGETRKPSEAELDEMLK